VSRFPGDIGSRARRTLVLAAPELVAIAGAIAWFFYLGYGPTLRPTFVSWLWRDDWAAYHWGFSFFRNAPWTWPLGSIPDLFYPHGTSVGFTDANPWLCVLFKLWSPLLPRDFQFFGLWYLLCFVLQAWFGAQICRAFTRDPLRIALAGLLFATTPVLPVRARHLALCALFFVTAGVWLNLKRVESSRVVRRDLVTSWLLLAWAAGTHAYLSAMLLALCCAYYARLSFVERLISVRQGAGALLLAFGVTLAVYYLFGFIGWQHADLSVPGFGLYSADLTTLFNPQGLSLLIPALPVQPMQWEGFAYLGLGTMALLLLCAARIAAAPRAWLTALRRRWPLLVVSLAAFFYALSSQITWCGTLLADLSALYAPVAELTGTFRSSGRFAWLLHLGLTALAIRAGDLPAYPRISRALLALALALSVVEQDTALYQLPPAPHYRFMQPAWHRVGRDYHHLAIVPIQLQWECPYSEELVNALSDLAYRERLSFNSGNFMRKPPGVNALCNAEPSALDARTVYVVAQDRVAALRTQGALCGQIEGVDVCVTRGRRTTLSAALGAAP
jgi:hypothetical protein